MKKVIILVIVVFFALLVTIIYFLRDNEDIKIMNTNTNSADFPSASKPTPNWQQQSR